MPPKDSRIVALMEVPYEKNAKHVLHTCGYSDIVNEKKAMVKQMKTSNAHYHALATKVLNVPLI